MVSPAAPESDKSARASLAEWLALRRTADYAARSNRLTEWIADRLRGRGVLHLLDLGTGTGSNVDYLATRLGSEQYWLAVDKDAALMSAGTRPATAETGVHVETRVVDLGLLTAPEIFDGRDLVTASALLDLVSERWLRWVASQCRRVGACALFTLTYNGRNECEPADADDALVFSQFDRHQVTDKGLAGAAAGPFATEVARRAFNDLGFDVRVESSDWQLDTAEAELQRELIQGWAVAAAEIDPEQRDRIEAWRLRRLAHVTAGESRILVGHYDLAAL